MDISGVNMEMVEQRLVRLREEFAAGERQEHALEQRLLDLRNTMQRIAGAIAVLEELQREAGGHAPAE